MLYIYSFLGTPRLTGSHRSNPSLHVSYLHVNATPRFDPSVSIPPKLTGADSSYQRILRVAPSNLITATPSTRSSRSDPSVRISTSNVAASQRSGPSTRPTFHLTGLPPYFLLRPCVYHLSILPPIHVVIRRRVHDFRPLY